jgi:hypothetical protein
VDAEIGRKRLTRLAAEFTRERKKDVSNQRGKKATSKNRRARRKS